MPDLFSHPASTTTKVLVVGDSKSGKTGALISLILAGYNLRVLDFDNGLDILVNLIKQAIEEKKLTREQATERFRYVTLTDKYKNIGGKAVLSEVPTAFSRGMTMLTQWKEGKKDSPEYFELPPLEKWTDKDVLVLDTLNFLGKAAMNYVVYLGGRHTTAPWQADYGTAQRMIESTLQLLYSDSVACNVVVNSHVVYVEHKIGEGKEAVTFDPEPSGYPAFGAGKKLASDIPRYFNSMLLCKTTGAGKREIHTRSKGLIELGSSNPKVPATLPLETGLATFFHLAQGK